MVHPIGKKNQCQAFTLKNSQCKNRCIENFCKLHDPKECEKRKNVRQLYKAIEERNYKFLKYVERECKKARISHRKSIERMEKKKKYVNIQCKATTKKGLPCKISTRSEYCHVHKYLDTNVEKLIEKEPEDDSIMISFRKEIEDKYRGTQPRLYIGPELDSDKMEKINSIYLNEMKRELNIYGRIINNLVNEPDVKLNIDDINDIKKETEESLNKIYQKTNEAIRSITKSNKKSKRTKKFPQCDIDSIIKEIEELKSQIQIREYKGPELDDNTQRRVDKFYRDEMNNKINNLDGISRAISSCDPLEDIEEIQDLRKESKRTIKGIEKYTDTQVKDFTAAVLRKNRKPLSKY
jgi:hypothetical protein